MFFCSNCQRTFSYYFIDLSIFLRYYFFFIYFHIIFLISSLSLAFFTITSRLVMFFCPNCQCTFSSSRGLSIHCDTCNYDNNYTPLPSSSNTSQDHSTKHHLTNKTPISDILQNMSSTKKRKISDTNNSI